MKHLLFTFIILAFCVSANAELLVYQTSTKGQQFSIADKIIQKKSERGYLVINVNLENPENIVVNEIYYLHYESQSGTKIQYTTIPGDVEVIFVDIDKGKKIILRCFDETTGTYMVVYGTAAIKDLGGVSRYASNSLKGHSAWRELDFRTGSGSINLRLDTKATKAANTTAGKTIENIIDSYAQALTAKGYSAE